MSNFLNLEGFLRLLLLIIVFVSALFILLGIFIKSVDVVTEGCEILKTFRSNVRNKWVYKQHIIKAPGTELLAIGYFLFRPATVELTFKPLIADWQSEYFEALKQGRRIKARWISFRYRFIFACTFIKAMGLSTVFSFFKQLSK